MEHVIARSACPRSSVVGEATSLLDVFLKLKVNLAANRFELLVQVDYNTSQNFTCKKYYSKVGTIRLVH
jgi:hypothetical protein